MMMGGGGNPNVFTAAQWEELEQQALIYKYMVSGVPVPTHLILSVTRSLYHSSNSSSSSSSLSYNHLTFGGAWEGGYPYNHHQLYQIGGGGRKIDLEPGRCRRTDGKKWRCSKEAFPDSKYCERHMHRGRNRSRKPVELSSSSSSTAVTPNVSSSLSTTISKSAEAYPPPFSSIHTNFITSSSSYSSQTLKDYRHLQQVGVKELGENERSSFFQPSDPFNTIPKMQSGQHHHFSFQNLKDHQKVEQTQGQHCFVMGTDFIKPSEETSTKSSATQMSQMDTKFDQTTSKQPFHHFFSPPKTTMNPTQDPNWVDVDHQLSIIPPKAPLSTQDLFQSKPRPYW